MTDNPSKPSPPETQSLLGRIDEICDRFEADWNEGKQLRIEDYLRDVGDAARETLLQELLALELDLRRRADQHPNAAEYHRRFPEGREQVDAAFAMVTRSFEKETRAQTRRRSKPQQQGLHVRCPHCRRPIEIGHDRPLTQVTCSACGGSFRLADDRADTRVAPATKRLGRFDLIEPLGSGHFGTVWKAQDSDLDRTVAVKIPRKGRLDPQEQELFLREARTAAQLNHPNIVNVHEVGREGDTIYIVSDILRGVSLSEWLSLRRPEPSEAARLCLKIARALHHAHLAGVVHRDLKPANIMIDDRDEPHVTDFGLARRDVGEVTMTVEGRILGTPAYMSPEQAGGHAHEADGRSDVYSLGVILYQLLTGELPFRGSERMLLLQVLNEEPPSLRRLDSHVPRDLETVCLKCLEKDPGRRYATAAELARELERFLGGHPIQARPVSTIGRAWRWYRRNPKAPFWITGGFVTINSAVLMLWGLAGLAILGLGIVQADDCRKAISDIAILVICLYLPMFWVGTRILSGRIHTLWMGLALYATGLCLSLVGLLGYAFDSAVYGDVDTRTALFTLLAILCFLGLVLHVVAVFSWYTGRGNPVEEGITRDERRGHTRHGDGI